MSNSLFASEISIAHHVMKNLCKKLKVWCYIKEGRHENALLPEAQYHFACGKITEFVPVEVDDETGVIMVRVDNKIKNPLILKRLLDEKMIPGGRHRNSVYTDYFFYDSEEHKHKCTEFYNEQLGIQETTSKKNKIQK